MGRRRWRGYSNLQFLDPDTLEEKWQVDVWAQDIQEFAIAVILSESALLLANHTKRSLEIREINSGEILARHIISNDFECPDLAHSCRIVAGNAVFLSWSGVQLTVDAESLTFSEKKLNIKRNGTALPLINNSHMVIDDGSGKYWLYDRGADELIWEIRMESNLRERTLAAFLDDCHILLAGSMGQLKLVNDKGEKIGRMKSFRRITTELMCVGNYVLFGGKSEIAALRWKK